MQTKPFQMFQKFQSFQCCRRSNCSKRSNCSRRSNRFKPDKPSRAIRRYAEVLERSNSWNGRKPIRTSLPLRLIGSSNVLDTIGTVGTAETVGTVFSDVLNDLNRA